MHYFLWLFTCLAYHGMVLWLFSIWCRGYSCITISLHESQVETIYGSCVFLKRGCSFEGGTMHHVRARISFLQTPWRGHHAPCESQDIILPNFVLAKNNLFSHVDVTRCGRKLRPEIVSFPRRKMKAISYLCTLHSLGATNFKPWSRMRPRAARWAHLTYSITSMCWMKLLKL